MRIIMAQENPLVGDIEGNAERVIAATEDARRLLHADLVLFPELMLTGYPPEDLLLRPSLNSRVDAALARIAEAITVPVVLGYPAVRNGIRRNTAGVLLPGEKQPAHEYYKRYLPNYRVFDEKRYFQPGSKPVIFELDGVKIGLSICEDVWYAEPCEDLKAAGAQLMLSLNASPFRLNKMAERQEQVAGRCHENQLPLLYCNMVGGQDELVFDGGSFAMGADGQVVVQGACFQQALVPVDVEIDGDVCRPSGNRLAVPDDCEALYQALVLATRDYVNKNGFKGALLGLSGGIDSALTLAIAVDALGAERVEAVMMPFRYTSEMSIEDAAQQAKTLKVTYRSLPIEAAFNGFMDILSGPFEGLPVDTTEENLQARCRGVLLMALSNKSGAVVLTTGNKSEMAVGYATLYGDMAGGFSVIKDVFKTWVFKLSRWRNQQAGYEIIPERVITRPPSAELAPDQVDSDSLPDYDELDNILMRYVEQDMSAEAVIREGFDRDTVYRVVRLTDRNEYKRRQAAVGPRVSRRGFGKDRRYPITNGWRPGD